MADFYDENKFNLKQDWNWGKIFHKADDWIHQEAYDNAYNNMLEYLEIGSEDELTEVHLDECQALLDYLETPYAEGGEGMDMNGHSPTYYAYYRVMQDWIENFDYGEVEGAPLS
jgi:hypothetical protein